MKKEFAAWLLLFLLSLTINAQQQKRISLEEAVRLGLENSKSMKLTQAKVDIANAKYSQALDAVLPNVTASASYQRLSDLDPPKVLFPGAAEPVAIFPVYVNSYSSRLSASEIIFS